MKLDLVGQKFGKLKVVERAEQPKHHKKKQNTYFLVECECGRRKVVSGSNLRTGSTKSCGFKKCRGKSGFHINSILKGKKQCTASTL